MLESGCQVKLCSIDLYVASHSTILKKYQSVEIFKCVLKIQLVQMYKKPVHTSYNSN